MAEAGQWSVDTKLVPTTNEQYRELRHLPEVVAHITDLANRTVNLIEQPNLFEVRVQNNPGTQRARALIHPANSEGIKLELKDSVLVKAIASMAGQ